MLNDLQPVTTRNNRARLISVVALDGRDESTLLGFAASLARGLEAPLATAILDSARERETPIAYVEHFDQPRRRRIAASVAGHSVVLGDEALFTDLGLSIDGLGDWPERLQRQGQSVLLLAVDGRTAGLLGIAEDNMQTSVFTKQNFPTETTGLPSAASSEVFELGDGDHFDLRIAPVTKRVGNSMVRMLSYNGSVPGPTLRVQQGSELLVTVVNDGDLETTVHWHGLRLDNRYDGTTKTQRPIPVGGTFTYRLAFPDPGVYWYHPHIREDYGQEMGLYGNIVVVPAAAEYWRTVNREVTVTLDDILLENGKLAPFSRSFPTYTAMGRFGNVLLINGEPDMSFRARCGEVVRFYLTNTANTRVFSVRLRGVQMKLVGGDSGRYEREALVDRVMIAPSERVVVDVLFEQAGEFTLEHQTPNQTYPLARITVDGERAEPSLAAQFENLRVNTDFAVERDRLEADRFAQPDKTLAFVAEMDMGESQPAANATAAYVCPMHPGVTSSQPDRCPRCGMKLVPAQLVSAGSHGEHNHHEHHDDVADDAYPSGIEWEDDMVEVNRMTTPANMRWKLIDRQTGAEGASIDWRFRVGDRVKIRLINEMDSDHPMHHPFHIHGAGRFLILSRDGVVEPNLVWKDTVLVPTGQTVDILLDVTHAGVWMAHCHIAEHHESGMMFSFRVDQ